MSDVFETKKITELQEATTADDSDLMMVGDPSTGELSKITKNNFLSALESSLSTKADQSEVDQINEDLSDVAGSLNSIYSSSFSILDRYTDASQGWTFGRIASGDVSVTDMPLNANFAFAMNKWDAIGSAGIILAFRYTLNASIHIFLRKRASSIWGDWIEIPCEDEITQINTSLSDLDERVTALEKATGISANESPSSIEPGPEESGDDDGTTVAPNPEVLNDDE